MAELRGHHVVVALGLALLLGAGVHHGREFGAVDDAAGPLLAFALDAGIAIAVTYAGRRVGSGDFSASEERRIARWTVAGTLIAIGAFGSTLLVRRFEGRPLVEPTFPLLVIAGAGALAGVIAGYYAVRQAVEARRARDATRAVSFVNHLLRHDLRNDLATIRGYADVVAGEVGTREGSAGSTGDDGSADRAADSDRAADRDPATIIAAKADEGLDRIETTSAVADALLGESDLRRVDLAAVTRDVVEGVADRRGVTVETDLADGAPVRANDGLRSVVDNLVENAVEHGGEDVTVRVAVGVGDDAVTLSVADDGAGIPAARRDTLFDPDDDGGGGLFLVDALVDGYGGTVSVGEADLGGTRFEVTLPRADGREPPADPVDSDN